MSIFYLYDFIRCEYVQVPTLLFSNFNIGPSNTNSHRLNYSSLTHKIIKYITEQLFTLKNLIVYAFHCISNKKIK